MITDAEKNNTYGIYKIFGEDPNCDFGGTHHQPYLGKLKGYYNDVLNRAKKMNRWSTWGGGGYIDLIDEHEFVEDVSIDLIDEHVSIGKSSDDFNNIHDLETKIKILKDNLEKLKKQKELESIPDFFMITLKQGFGSKVIHDTENIAIKEAKRLSKSEQKPAYIMKMHKIYYDGKLI